MAVKFCIIILRCLSILLVIQTLFPRAMTLKKMSNVNEFLVKHQRTHKRQNYVVERPFEDEGLANIDNSGYATEPFEPETSPEELPALIVDYANMIRNDIILLDNSVETRTRKRGNINVEDNNQAIPEFPCSCEAGKISKYLGEDFYPRRIETRNCSSIMCPRYYACKESSYELTVLKRKDSLKQETAIDIPWEFRHRWIGVKMNITIGCSCTRDYIEVN